MRGCARAEMKPAHVHTPTRTRKSPRAGLRSEPRRCYRNRAGRCPRTRRRTTAPATPTRRPRLAYVPAPLLPEGQVEPVQSRPVGDHLVLGDLSLADDEADGEGASARPKRAAG